MKKPSVGNIYRYLRENHEAMVVEVNAYISHGLSYTRYSMQHCAACAARSLFKLTDKQWNSPAGCEYYAASLAYIVHFNLFRLKDEISPA